MKSDEFFRRFKNSFESWKIIILMAVAKERAIIERVTKIKKMILENDTI